MGRVKNELLKARIVLPMEQRQAHAYASKLKKNPDAMAQMRSSLTDEVVRKRSESIRRRYAGDRDLRQRLSENSKEWWASLSEEEKSKLFQCQTGADSTRVKAILGLEGVESMTIRFRGIAAKKGGEFLGEYTGSHDMVWWSCKKDHKFEMQPYVVINGHWCPQCAHVGPSLAQLEIEAFIMSVIPELEVVRCSRKVIPPKELDIWVPDQRFALEFNGLFHHSSYFDTTPGRHYKKAIACRAAAVNLLAVFEDEWAIKRPLIEAMIRWRLHRFSGTTYRASDLELKSVNSATQEEFFAANHLDGHSRASEAYGLWNGPKLIQCLSLRTNFNKEHEICRMATDKCCRVHGGAQKLLQENGPSYWYTDGKTRVWRWKCRRNNDPAILAEFPTEVAQALGGVFSETIFGDDRPLYRIEDYGHRKWVLAQ